MAISPEYLRSIMRYDPETGILSWNSRTREMFSTDMSFQTWNGRYANKIAGRVGNKGYRRIHIFGRDVMAHRVAWAIYTGTWPTFPIDHIDHCRDNNRFINLRQVTIGENAKNKLRRKDNSSGATGVDWIKDSKKWRAKIKADGKFYHLGLFDEFGDAVAARMAAETRLGFHQNHGATP